MDIVYIRQLEIETVIGIYDWERNIKQIVRLDLDMAQNNRKAAQSDSIEDAVDYHGISKRLLEFVGESKFKLIETMAEQVAALVMEEFAVPWLRLRVSKPGAVQEAEDVGVVIERGQLES